MNDVFSSDLPANWAASVEGLYEAVAAPEAWAGALQRLARATNSLSAFFYPRYQGHALAQLPVPENLRDFINAYVDGKWYEVDPRAQRAWRAAERGCAVITDDQIMTPDEKGRSVYLQEFHRAWKMPECAAVPFKVDGNLWCMGLLRDERQGPVSSEQKRLLEALSPHLARTVGLAAKFDRRHATAQLDMLENVGCAAALLDWRGEVVGVTTAAEAFFGTEIAVRRRRLAIKDCPASHRMRITISLAATGKLLASEFVTVPREARRPLVIQVTALPSQLSDMFGRSCVLLRFYDGETKVTADREALRMAFELTPAEARLAVELGQEHSIDHIAEKFAVSEQTVRVQLKSVLRKTGTHKQSELIALMANMPRAE